MEATNLFESSPALLPTDVISAMQQAEAKYPDTGYCFERSTEIRRLLNRGEVITFSRCGLSKVYSPDAFNREMSVAEHITIPFRMNYKDNIHWAYHTVYLCDGIVYSYELENNCMNFKDYRTELNRLNNTIIKAVPEKQISYLDR